MTVDSILSVCHFSTLSARISAIRREMFALEMIFCGIFVAELFPAYSAEISLFNVSS